MAEALKQSTGITDEQLDSKIDDDILWELAGHLGNYKLYAGVHGFNFNNATMEDLKASAIKKGNQYAMYEALEKWSGTCRSLVEIIIKLTKRSIAEKVCEIVVTRRIRYRKTRSSETRVIEPSKLEPNDIKQQLDTIRDLREVYGALISAAVEWYDLGLSLGINPITLHNIKSTNKENTVCLREMLYRWLQSSSSCTWTDVCKGLRSPTLQLNNLAKFIEEAYCNKDDTIMSEEDTDALEKLLLDNKIEGFSLTGDSKTYRRVKHHLRELGHMEFAASLRSHLDKEISASRALDEAMKAGNVRVKITNILLFGMAGTGKTSTKHLLLGLDPPASRNSTPLAEKAEKAQIRQIREASNQKIQGAKDDSTSIWQPITSDGLLDFIADVIKCKKYESKRKVIPKEIVTALKARETSQDYIENLAIDSSNSSKSNEFTLSALESAKLMGIKEEDQDSNNGAFTRTVSNIMKSVQQACNLRDDDASSVREKLGSNWIYLIDSGGQPHFHNLLPLFIPKISVALYILRLSDRLDHHPKIEYYKDGRPVGRVFISETSVLDNYKHLVQSIQSHNIDCKLLCIGTHKDQQLESKGETLDEKNKILKAFSDQNKSVKNMTLFYDLKKKDVIIPLNCKEPDIESKNNTSKICQIVNSYQDIEILVPIWWYALELVIDKFSANEHRKILSKNECVKIAQNLNKFHELALIEALKFFHKHHIFHYYSDILPEVVFCDTQVLLDKVTELVEHAAYIRDSNDSVFGSGIWVDFVEKGMITFEILSAKTFQEHYVDGLFTPNELITIFQHLLIATPSQAITFKESFSQKDVFYVPSLLSMVPLSKLCEIRTDSLNSSSVPLVLQLKDKWQSCGVFCCLQVYLIQKCHWEVKIKGHSPSQNFVQLRHEDEPCSITLIDHLSFFEIHSKISSNNAKQESRILSLICHNILSGLESAYKVLNYLYNQPQAAFFCPCCPTESIQSATPTIAPHLAIALTTSKQLRCTQQNDEDKYFKFEPGHSNWIAAINNQSHNADSTDEDDTNQQDKIHGLNEVFSALIDAAEKWYNLGLSLGIKSTTLTNIKSTNNANCLREMLEHWLQSSPSCTWTNVCEGLRSPTVQFNHLAKTIKETHIATKGVAEPSPTMRPSP